MLVHVFFPSWEQYMFEALAATIPTNSYHTVPIITNSYPLRHWKLDPIPINFYRWRNLPLLEFRQDFWPSSRLMPSTASWSLAILLALPACYRLLSNLPAHLTVRTPAPRDLPHSFGDLTLVVAKLVLEFLKRVIWLDWFFMMLSFWNGVAA